MKYVNRLTNEQIIELIGFDTEDDFFDYNNFKITKHDNHIQVNFVDETYLISDFYYDIIIWDGNSDMPDELRHEFNKNYRENMLEYFGEQYAIDYLLGE